MEQKKALLCLKHNVQKTDTYAKANTHKTALNTHPHISHLITAGSNEKPVVTTFGPSVASEFGVYTTAFSSDS